MKRVSFVTAVAGAAMVIAAFLPYDFSGTMWHPGTLGSPFYAVLFLVGALAVTQLAGFALRNPEVARWCGIAIAATSTALAVGVMIHFIPLFDDGPSTLASLFDDGGIGAQALWLAALVAGTGGVAMAILQPRRRVRHPVGQL